MPISQRLKKYVKSLHQKQFRDENELFVAEGEKLAMELLSSNYQTELIVVRESSSGCVIELADQFSEKGVSVYIAPKHQFDQLCDTKAPQGIISVVSYKEQICYPDESFIALDGVSDPGNVGTIIRNADWFGIKQVIISSECSDAFNPKTIRSSMGSIFRVSILYADDLVSYINQNFKAVKLFGADVGYDKLLSSVRPTKQFGLIFGNESKGISEEVAKQISSTFKIEGFGECESLNVAVSVGISLYHFTLRKK